MFNENDSFYVRAKEMTASLDLSEKLGLLSTHQFPVERLGIKEFFVGAEVARGFVGRDREHISTVFPQPIGLASTFDTELMGKLGEIAGTEARAYYNMEGGKYLHLWGPTIDMERNPLWGRTEEAYGEDPCLSGEMSAAYTKTMAGENKDGFYRTMPTLKHFCANNNEEDRGGCNAFLPPRLKREYYYAPFENAVKNGGARSLMTAYNEINGAAGVMNPDLKNVLKKEWGLWFTVSDGGDFSQNVTAHKNTEKNSEAYKYCVQAGSDLMTDDEWMVMAAAKKALDGGLITEEDIDRVVTDILYARIRLGEFDSTDFDSIGKADIDTEESRKTNLRAALEQVTLLKNSGLLPIENKQASLAVLGPAANEMLMDWYTGYASYGHTVLDGIKNEYEGEIVHDSLWDIVAIKAANGKYLCAHEDGSLRADADAPVPEAQFELQDWGENWKNLFSVKYERYVRLPENGILSLHNRTIYDWFTRETFHFRNYEGKVLIEELLDHKRMTVSEDGGIIFSENRAANENSLFSCEIISFGKDRAKRIAEEADVVIYCSGNYPVQTAKECFDRKTLAINVQPGMTEWLAENNPKTVLVMVSSYPYAIVKESEAAAAVLYTSHAGPELGTAVAHTLSGKNNPSGHTPITWYRSELELPDILDYDIEKGATYMYFKGKALYPFGFGLSYSDFETDGLEMVTEGDRLFAKIRVRNISKRKGTAVIQLYYTLEKSALPRPAKKLCGFCRTELEPGEEKEAIIPVNKDYLRVYDVRSAKMQTEEGSYLFMAGFSSEDITETATAYLGNWKQGQREKAFYAADYDSIAGAELFSSKNEQKEYVRAVGWMGEVSYSGVKLEGAKSIELRAASFMGQRKVTLLAGGDEYELELEGSDSFDDFKTYTVEIKPCMGDTLRLKLPMHVAVMEIRLCIG